MTEATLWKLLRTGPWRERVRWALRILSPWVLEWWLHNWARRRGEVKMIRETPRPDDRVEAAFRFLVARGLDEHQIRAGSVPGQSLSYVADVVADHLPQDRPVRALHVGNFVGVSLCYFSWLVRDRHPDSVMVSVDPNIPHRGIEDPEGHARALLTHFGVIDCNVIIRGYTLERPASPEQLGEPIGEQGAENVLMSLSQIAAAGFDLVFIDGDHEERYVARELSALSGLLAENAIVVFDDIVHWAGVANVFARALDDMSFLELGQDGRVGILQVHTAEHPSLAAS